MTGAFQARAPIRRRFARLGSTSRTRPARTPPKQRLNNTTWPFPAPFALSDQCRSDAKKVSGRWGYRCDGSHEIGDGKSEPQKRHLMASARMSSAQKGHFFVTGSAATAAIAREKSSGPFRRASSRDVRSVTAQTRAITQPRSVHPKKRLTKNTAVTARFRFAATIVGKK
jgi:hypothetical protein